MGTRTRVLMKEGGLWRGSQQMDTHKDKNNDVPPELPDDEHHTNSPWRLGGEKPPLSLYSMSFLTQCPIYLLYLTSRLFSPSLPHSSLRTLSYPLCWLVCVRVRVHVRACVRMSCRDCSIRLGASGKLCLDCRALCGVSNRGQRGSEGEGRQCV